ncbi:unnamed protein product [Durusdinium trenchii]|uniref:Uncharacterized protein n=1 Tax=Durusdinium trenchii TaxID=1381693 RepID=A0ABP0P8I3_9DINO
MDQCTQRLNTIQSTTEVASAVVAALADAGSRLQHCATASRKLKPDPWHRDNLRCISLDVVYIY